MQKKLDQLFHALESSDSSSDLLEVVMVKIRHEQRRRILFYRTIPSFVGLLFSGAWALSAFLVMIQEANQSGFVDFFKAFFTDFATVASSLQSYALTLLDTLPIMSLAGTCAGLFVFFWILRFYDHSLFKKNVLLN